MKQTIKYLFSIYKFHKTSPRLDSGNWKVTQSRFELIFARFLPPLSIIVKTAQIINFQSYSRDLISISLFCITFASK